MATGKCFEEPEEPAAPVLAERGCIEDGFAAVRDSVEVEDSKESAVATNRMTTES